MPNPARPLFPAPLRSMGKPAQLSFRPLDCPVPAPTHHAASDGEAQTGALDARALTSPEPVEHAFPIAARNAWSVIGDRNRAIVTDPHLNLIALRAIEDGVLDNIADRVNNRGRVA